MDFWKTIFHVFPLLLLLLLPNVTSEEMQKSSLHTNDKFYHDLTLPIDKILEEDDASYHEILRRALKASPFVFYGTDMLLKNFENILPVIDLLQQLKPEGSNPQIILSLRYVNQTNNYFLETRICDMYYPLKLNLSLNDRSKIINHVAAVVLDFEAHLSYGSNFYMGDKYATNTIFTSYVKNYISLHFGNGAIPIGLMYGEGKHFFVTEQISDADFLVYCVKLNSFSNFPMFMTEYNQIMSRQNKNNIEYLRTLPKKPVTIMMKNEASGQTEDITYNYVSSDNFWSTFSRVIKAMSHYESVSKLFMKETLHRSLDVFMTAAVNWAELNGRNIIIRNPKQNFIERMNESTDGRFHLIVPSLNIQENVNICELKTNLSRWESKYKSLMMTEKTWRTMVRFQHDLENPKNSKCITDSSKIAFPMRGILNFSTGISKYWGDVYENMNSLLYDFQTVANVQLTTVIFPEEDIKASPEIQRFMNVSKQRNLTIGCSLSFYSLRYLFSPIYYGNEPLTNNTFKDTLQEKLCQPMFQLLDVFVWHVNENQGRFTRSGLSSSYSDLMLGRELFMKEFPEKKVLISFSRKEDHRIIAEMYDVPVVEASD